MKNIFLIFILSLVLASNMTPVKAADTYKLLAPLPCIEGVGGCIPGKLQEEITLNDYIAYVYKFAVAISVFLAIVMIIWGGFLTATSETPFKIADGKSKIQNAVIGLAMVFVSYLILITVDPRLVDIKTQLPPIISSLDLEKMKEVNQGFQNQLSANLAQKNDENQIKIIEMNEGINNKVKQKSDIDASIANKGINALTGKELADAKIESEKLGSEITKGKLDVRFIMAQSAGAKSYSDVLNALNNPNSNSDENPLDGYLAKTVPNTKVNGKLPTDTPNLIQREYNIQINEIYRSNTNYEMADTLTKQRDFYITTAQEEVKLNNLIRTNDSPMQGTGEDIIMIDKTKELKSQLTSYQKDIADPAKQSASGLNAEEYKAIYQARIGTIEKILNPPKP